jgi:hypothetical protein
VVVWEPIDDSGSLLLIAEVFSVKRIELAVSEYSVGVPVLNEVIASVDAELMDTSVDLAFLLRGARIANSFSSLFGR